MVTIKCTLFKNFSVREVQIAKIGLAYLNECLNDPQFQQTVLQAKFMGTKDLNVTILEKLLSGADRYDEKMDATIDLQFVMYSRWWSRVIGYVLDGNRTIYTNRKYFGDPIDFGSNALHEYMHLLNYDHSNAHDFGSVPYKINNLFEAWCILKGYK
jgi:hypothetical protein